MAGNRDINLLIGADMDYSDMEKFIAYLRKHKNVLAETLKVDKTDILNLARELQVFSVELDKIKSKTADGVLSVKPADQEVLQKYSVLLEKMRLFKSQTTGTKVEIKGADAAIRLLSGIEEKAAKTVVQKVEVQVSKPKAQKEKSPYEVYTEDLKKYQRACAEAKATLSNFEAVSAAGGVGMDALYNQLHTLHLALTAEQARLNEIWKSQKAWPKVIQPFTMPQMPTGPPGSSLSLESELAAFGDFGNTPPSSGRRHISNEERAYRDLLAQYRVDRARLADGVPSVKTIDDVRDAYSDLLRAYELLSAKTHEKLPLPPRPPRVTHTLPEGDEPTGTIYSSNHVGSTSDGDWIDRRFKNHVQLDPADIKRRVSAQERFFKEMLRDASASERLSGPIRNTSMLGATNIFGSIGNIVGGGINGFKGLIGDVEQLTRHSINLNSAFHEMRNILFAIYGLQIFVNMVQGAGELERAMARINTLLDTSYSKLEGVKEKLKAQAADNGINALELAKGLYNVTSSGIKASESQYALAMSSKAAVAGVTDVDTAVRAGATSMLAFGKNASDLPAIFGAQFAMVDKGIGSYEDFANVLGFVNANAATLGMTYQETYGALAFLTRQGFTASESATRLGNAIAAITAKDNNIKEKLGVDAFDDQGQFKGFLNFLQDVNAELSQLNPEERATKLQEVFGEKRTVQAIMSFTNNLKDADAVIQSVMKSSGDTLNTAWQNAATGIHHQIDILGARFYNFTEEVSMAVATEMLPTLMSIVETLDKIDFKTVISNLREALTGDNVASLKDFQIKSLFSVEVFTEIKKIIEALLMVKLAMTAINLTITKGPMLLGLNAMVMLIGAMKNNALELNGVFEFLAGTLDVVSSFFEAMLNLVNSIAPAFASIVNAVKIAQLEGDRNKSATMQQKVADWYSENRGKVVGAAAGAEYQELIKELSKAIKDFTANNNITAKNEMEIVKKALMNSYTITPGLGPGEGYATVKSGNLFTDAQNEALSKLGDISKKNLDYAKGNFSDSKGDFKKALLTDIKDYVPQFSGALATGYEVLIDKLSDGFETGAEDIETVLRKYLSSEVGLLPKTEVDSRMTPPGYNNAQPKLGYNMDMYDLALHGKEIALALFDERTLVAMADYEEALTKAKQRGEDYRNVYSSYFAEESALTDELFAATTDLAKANNDLNGNQDIKKADELKSVRDDIVERIALIRNKLEEVQKVTNEVYSIENVGIGEFTKNVVMPTGSNQILSVVDAAVDKANEDQKQVMYELYNSYTTVLDIAEANFAMLSESSQVNAETIKAFQDDLDVDADILAAIRREIYRRAKELNVPIKYEPRSYYDTPHSEYRGKLPYAYKTKLSTKAEQDMQSMQESRQSDVNNAMLNSIDILGDLTSKYGEFNSSLANVGKVIVGLVESLKSIKTNGDAYNVLKGQAATTGIPISSAEKAGYAMQQGVAIYAAVSAVASVVGSALAEHDSKKVEKLDKEYQNQIDALNKNTDALEGSIEAFTSVAEALSDKVLNSSLGSPTDAVSKLKQLYDILAANTQFNPNIAVAAKAVGNYGLGIKKTQRHNYSYNIADWAGLNSADGIDLEELRALRDRINDPNFRAEIEKDAKKKAYDTYFDSQFLDTHNIDTSVSIDWDAVNRAITAHIALLEKYGSTIDALNMKSKFSGYAGVTFTSAAESEASMREQLRDAGASEANINDIIAQMKTAGLIADELSVSVGEDLKASIVDAFGEGANMVDAFNSALAGIGQTVKKQIGGELYKALFGDFDTKLEDSIKDIVVGWEAYKDKLKESGKTATSDDIMGTMVGLINGSLPWEDLLKVKEGASAFDAVLAMLKDKAIKEHGFTQEEADNLFGLTTLEQTAADIASSIRDAMGNAMSAAIDGNSIADFNAALGQGIYDHVKEALIQAFTEGELYKQFISKWVVTDAVLDQVKNAGSMEEALTIIQGILTGTVDSLKGAGLWGTDNAGYGSNTTDTSSSYYTEKTQATTQITYKQYYFAPNIENLYGENQTELFKKWQEWKEEEEEGQA